jgi:hypothetical protein
MQYFGAPITKLSKDTHHDELKFSRNKKIFLKDMSFMKRIQLHWGVTGSLITPTTTDFRLICWDATGSLIIPTTTDFQLTCWGVTGSLIMPATVDSRLTEVGVFLGFLCKILLVRQLSKVKLPVKWIAKKEKVQKEASFISRFNMYLET